MMTKKIKYGGNAVEILETTIEVLCSLYLVGISNRLGCLLNVDIFHSGCHDTDKETLRDMQRTSNYTYYA